MRPALQNKRVVVLRVAFRTRKRLWGLSINRPQLPSSSRPLLLLWLQGVIGRLNSNDGTATKTSLENKHLGKGDYFVIISSFLHLLLLTEHAANGLVEAML